MIEVGDRFGRLVILKERTMRHKDGHKVYICQCDCGNIAEVRDRDLLSGDTTSCNCYRKEQVAKRYINKTQPDRIFSHNLNKNNKSGIKGVCFDKKRNKWLASFQYQGKHYNLGRFNNIGDAEKARKKFEDKIKLELGGCNV